MKLKIVKVKEVHRDATQSKYPYTELLNEYMHPLDMFVIMNMYYVDTVICKYKLN